MNDMTVAISTDGVVEIPVETSFDVPEGRYRAKLQEVAKLENRQTRNGRSDLLRLIFELQSPPRARVQYLAGKNYELSLSRRSELRKDLKSWRGFDLTEEEVNRGKIDLESMVGQMADVRICHIQNPGYTRPYVCIKSIHPAGTFKESVESLL